jgi:hypothetical protein
MSREQRETVSRKARGRKGIKRRIGHREKAEKENPTVPSFYKGGAGGIFEGAFQNAESRRRGKIAAFGFAAE